MRYFSEPAAPRKTNILPSLVLALACLAAIFSVILLDDFSSIIIVVVCVLLILMLQQTRRVHDLVRANLLLKEEIAKERNVLEIQRSERDELRRLAVHQEQIREDERKRIASEVHDALGQNLLALRLDVAILHARTAAQAKLHKKTGYALHTIDAAMQSVRDIIGDLRPAVLDLGLAAAVDWQLKEFERIHRIRCTLLTDETAFNVNLDDGRTVLIFRILQEALANTARHAKATEIEVELRLEDELFSMAVKDNGMGFLPIERRGMNGFGLMGIKARIDSLGGELIIKSGNGTLLSVSFPLSRERRNQPKFNAYGMKRDLH